jgi:hypothetical protein
MNPVRWFEIYVADMDRAKTFYETVLGITMTKLKDDGDLLMWQFPSDPDGYGTSGALTRMKGLTPSGISSIVYFASDDCAIEQARVVKNGGRLHKEKFSIGEYGYITLAYDTEGNMFGIHSMH